MSKSSIVPAGQGKIVGARGSVMAFKAVAAQTDGELFWKISEGHRPMPAFKKKLSEQERWQLVDYIRTFSQSANTAPADSPSTPAAEGRDHR